MVKSMQIGLLVVAGAIGGALLMKITHSAPPAPATAIASAPAPLPAAAPAVAATPPPAAPAAQPVRHPSPFPEKAEHKAAPAHRARHKPEVRTVAGNRAPDPEPAAVSHPAQPAAAPTHPDNSWDNSAAQAKVPGPPLADPTPTPPPPSVTIAAGTVIPIRTVEALSSQRNAVGDEFTGTLEAPLVAGGYAIAERGARVQGKIVQVQQAGRVKGLASLGIQLTRITTSDGQHIKINTDTFTKQGPKSTGEDAAKVGAGAGIGAVIGAIAGGGKGAALGAIIGGAAGTGDVLYTRGKPAEIRSETRVDFRLAEPVTVTEKEQ